LWPAGIIQQTKNNLFHLAERCRLSGNQDKTVCDWSWPMPDC
jgi:hypothetical protein